MDKLNYLQFAKEVPTVSYNNAGTPPIKWKFFWTGNFGHGYYALTVNGRRHPKGKFKIVKQVWLEYLRNTCSILK
jgi:hypothetical protein